MEKPEEKISKSSKIIKSAVIELSEKINHQGLIIESIDNETDKNAKYLFYNMNKFGYAITKMKSDPRNMIILVLILICLGLIFYLFS